MSSAGSGTKSGLNLISQAQAATKNKDSMAGEFGPAGLDRPDFILPRFMQGQRDLQPGEIGFEAAYGAGLRPFDESDEVMGSQIPRMPGKEGAATYQDLLNLEEGSRAESGFIDPVKVFGGPAVDTGEGEIVTKDGKDFVRTKVTEKDVLEQAFRIRGGHDLPKHIIQMFGNRKKEIING